MEFKIGDLIKYIPSYLPWKNLSRDIEYVTDVVIIGFRDYIQVNEMSHYLISSCVLVSSILREHDGV